MSRSVTRMPIWSSSSLLKFMMCLAPRASSGLQAGAGFLKGDKAGQGLDLAQPALNAGIGGQIYIAFGGAFYIAVQCNVRNRGIFGSGNPALVFQAAFHSGQGGMGARNYFFGIEAGTKHGDQSSRTGAVGNLARQIGRAHV